MLTCICTTPLKIPIKSIYTTMKTSNHIDSFAFLDGSVNFEKSFSIAFNPLVLIVLFIAGIVFSVNWVGKHTIIKFNKWLDNEKV